MVAESENLMEWSTIPVVFTCIKNQLSVQK